MPDADLLALADKWEQLAKSKFDCAKQKHTYSERQFIEHGAMMYLNCAADLRRLMLGDGERLSDAQLSGPV